MVNGIGPDKTIRMFAPARPDRGFTLLELAVYIAVAAVVMAVMIPALTSARTMNFRAICADNQREIGVAWAAYVEAHDEFPHISDKPGWNYGGVRFSPITGQSYLEHGRPLNAYLSQAAAVSGQRDPTRWVFCCPSDDGTAIGHRLGESRMSACRRFGTSYRANEHLLDFEEAEEAVAPGNNGVPGTQARRRGIRPGEITTSPSRLLIMGDAMWYEIYEGVGSPGNWHGPRGNSNMLFLDGSVRFGRMTPRGEPGAIVLDPQMTGPLGGTADGSVGFFKGIR